jgi:hypothetical protein
MFVLVPAGSLVDVRMHVSDVAVAVRVNVEAAAMPANQQPDRKRGDENADSRFGCASHGARKRSVQEHDRHPEQRERRRVSDSPGESEPARTSRAVALVAAEHERRKSGQVIRVRGVAQSKQDGHDKRERKRAAGA